MPKVRNVRTKEALEPRPKRVSSFAFRREEAEPDREGREAHRHVVAARAEQTKLGLSLSRLEPGGPVYVTALTDSIAQPPIVVVPEDRLQKASRRGRKTGPPLQARSSGTKRAAELEAENARLRAELREEQARGREAEGRLRLALAEADDRAARAAEEVSALAARLEVVTANVEMRELELRRVRQMEVESRLEMASEESMLRDALDEVARLQAALADQQNRSEPLREVAAAAQQRVGEALAYAERLELRVAQLERALADAHASQEEWQIEPVARPRRSLVRRLRTTSISGPRGLARMHSAWPLRTLWRVVKKRFLRILTPPAAPKPHAPPTVEAPPVLARVKPPKKRR